MRLEAIVQERTAEVVKQKDEIEEKSKSLETALSELSEAQSELVRQEKMATVGKLTQGLIDRILNPLNYINNFAKLSEGLVDDARANIEDEKDRMSPENYDDTIDVLTMLKGNLQKVGEHGSNTTRTLKAMEEVMKDRSSGIIKTDLVSMMHKDKEMLNTYYEKDITKYHIKCVFECPTTPIYIMANPELLSSSLMSLLNNSLYAVKKKAKRKEFTPEIDVTLTKKNDLAQIVIRDNGIGIEDTIIHKIFDPFFTTKTTGEASGVGLYLSREVIQNYGGDIRVASLKDEYTEFTIIIPTT
jgi:signal transduction histidine kinase